MQTQSLQKFHSKVKITQGDRSTSELMVGSLQTLQMTTKPEEFMYNSRIRIAKSSVHRSKTIICPRSAVRWLIFVVVNNLGSLSSKNLGHTLSAMFSVSVITSL